MERARLSHALPSSPHQSGTRLPVLPAHGRRIGAAAPSDFGGFGAAAPVSPGAAKAFILVVLRKRRLTVSALRHGQQQQAARPSGFTVVVPLELIGLSPARDQLLEYVGQPRKELDPAQECKSLKMVCFWEEHDLEGGQQGIFLMWKDMGNCNCKCLTDILPIG
jgi:hypothetical protein